MSETFNCGHPLEQHNFLWRTLDSGNVKIYCRRCRNDRANRLRARKVHGMVPYASRHELAAARLEDFDELAAAGESFEMIAKRLGLLPNSLGRFMNRHGRRANGQVRS